MFTCKQHIQQAVRITETDPESPYAHELGDTVQIEAPDFDPDIDDISSPSTDEKQNELPTQGTSSPASEVTESEDDSLTPATTIQQLSSQDTDWPDAVPMQIPNQAHIILKVLKFLIWRKILKKSSLPIWSHT